MAEFPAVSRTPYFAVFITGDGGLGTLVQIVTTYLQEKGVAVVVLNAAKYFWSEKKPATIANDLVRIKSHYLWKWNKKAVVYVGYSIGADVLPFALNAMASPELETTHDAILIAPAQKVTFVIALSDYIHDSEQGADIYPELKKLRIKRVYCIDDDRNDSAGKLDLLNVVDHITLKGGHHFGGDYPRLCSVIGRRLKLE